MSEERKILSINPTEISTPELHGYLLGAVSPRPIALVSTISASGDVNLSPFSFFNCFSARPPILIFSPARRVKGNTIKHTLENVREVEEAVVSIVSFDMAEQMSLSSTEYDRGVNEFIKSGLTPVPSLKIKPPRVEESPVSFECRVLEIKSLGEEGGAGNLVICEVVYIHINKEILTQEGKIDPLKLDPVARLGGNWYSKLNKEALFEIEKPVRMKGIGFDQMPDHVKSSTILTGNNLGRLGNTEQLPDTKEVENYSNNFLKEIKLNYPPASIEYKEALHRKAKDLIEQGNVEEAWMVLLSWM